MKRPRVVIEDDPPPTPKRTFKCPFCSAMSRGLLLYDVWEVVCTCCKRAFSVKKA